MKDESIITQPCFDSFYKADGYKVVQCVGDEIEESLRNTCAEVKRGGNWHECIQGALSPHFQLCEELTP